METNKTTKTDIYKIDPRNIVVTEGFNSREDFGDLELLATQIEENGILNPITVMPFKDEEGNEKYRLVDGERRYRAIMLLMDRGVTIDRVPALFIAKASDEKTQLIQQIIRNEGKRFNEMEYAVAFKKLIDAGMTKEEVAKKLVGGKVTKVEYCLAHLRRDERVQKLIADGEVSGVLVRAVYAAHKDDKDKEQAVNELIEAAKHNDNPSNLKGNSNIARTTKKNLLSNKVQLKQDSAVIRRGIALLLMYNDHYNPDRVPIGSLKNLCERLKNTTIDEILASAVATAKIKSA